jgi:8-oxo-dGTP pyrophosphatase MutT (NUDIX family)
MEKFTKLGRKKPGRKKDKVLFDNGYMKVIEYEDWSLMEESDIVVCIPYFVEENKFIIRQEYIPTFKYAEGQDYHITVLSGSIEEDEDILETLFREIEEEAGIILNENIEVEEIKPLFMTKGHVNKYHMFIIPIYEKDYQEVVAKGDGSKAEELSKSVKVDIKYINDLNISDLVTAYMLEKFKQYLNLER